jgi:hypothetical protein
MKTVYRLECSDGVGVHASSSKSQEVYEITWRWHNRHVEERPGFYDDFPFALEASIELRKQFRFGCESVESLKSWFTEEIYEALLATGEVKLVKYQSNKFFIGESGMQIAFIPEVAGEIIN